MGIREEFYQSLRLEYEQEGERSFLYHYFQTRPKQCRGGTGRPNVKKDVQTFLYDVEHGRKKDQVLAMLDEYYARRGVTSVLQGAGRDETLPVEELEEFCENLRRGDNDQILFPLKIDSGTGAGLYLMGTGYLREAGLELPGACCYACLSLDVLELYAPNDRQGDQYVWSIASVDRFQLEERCGFPNLPEALRWFSHLTAMDQEAYQAYSVNNGPAPDNCPKVLLRYFEKCREDDEALIAQGRESFAQDKLQLTS